MVISDQSTQWISLLMDSHLPQVEKMVMFIIIDSLPSTSPMISSEQQIYSSPRCDKVESNVGEEEEQMRGAVHADI
jgi:hypothetical protein